MAKTRGRYEKRGEGITRIGLIVVTAALILGFGLRMMTQRAQATTYRITDGETVVMCTSYETDPKEVLGEAGLSLGEQDTFTTEASEGNTSITINRARNVTISYHGTEQVATVQGGTVGELLARRGLAVSGEDLLSQGLEEEVTDGMVIRVDRITTVRETFSASIPYETTYCYDDTLPAGEEEILVPGKSGELLSTADVTYLNGEELGRDVLSQTQTRAPVTQIVAKGTAQKEAAQELPEIGDGYIKLPTGEVLTYTRKDYVRATAYTHTDSGCDMITATGTTVHWGTVAVDPRNIPYGTRMFIMASDGSYVYGIAAAEDCGGDIKGDRMDLYMPTFEECMQFGRRRCTIYFLG